MRQNKILQHNKRVSEGTLRIIGGLWRGRRLPFADITQMRPTLDHIRERLFNWLMFNTEGARCLDAFAGSGALGIEALSRQAGEVVFLEKAEEAAKFIENNMKRLHCNHYQLFNMDALQWLKTMKASPFDIVFLDPPFHQNLIMPVCELLQKRKWLKINTLIYIEMEKKAHFIPPDNWQLTKQKVTKTTDTVLFRVVS
ncbi:MAG: 16S rRNA (guanine(966)-N(2))-methyltransferase RsmD [Endozoicomonadaceae bacterium]|nr:16S rRNA (guanine(966)-N(2))-methyltransferase RsmD [Endozoicomonadaceae bacterium]